MFQLFLIFHFLFFVEFQPVFLCCSYFLGKSQPDVSYKGCSYNKRRVSAVFNGKPPEMRERRNVGQYVR